MDDLGDLAWKSMGFNAKPAVRSANTPLNQLSGGTGARSGSSTPLGMASPQQLRTPPSYSPGHSAQNTPRMAANTTASPFFASQASAPTASSSTTSPLAGGVGAVKPRQFSSSATSSANHSRSASPGPSSLLGGGGGGGSAAGGRSEDVFGNLLSSMGGGGFAAKPNLSGMTMDQQRRYHEEQRQQEARAQAQKLAGSGGGGGGGGGDSPASVYGVKPVRPAVPTQMQQSSGYFGAQDPAARSRTPSNIPGNSGLISSSVLLPQRPVVAQGTAAPPPPVTAPSDAWDLDFLMSGGSTGVEKADAQGSASPAGGVGGFGHDPFDIGHLGKHLDQQNERSPKSGPGKSQVEDDNPLGLLAQPVSAVRSQTSVRSNPVVSPSAHAAAPAVVTAIESQPPFSRTPDEGFSTDNDFAIAQIVGMGFDDDSAAAALAASGNDLNMAIEILTQSRAAERELEARKHESPRGERPPSAKANAGQRRPAPDKPHRVAKFRDDYEAETSDDSDAVQGSSRGRSDPHGSAAITQEKIMQTASAIGTSVFKNAKSMLAYSKQKITAAAEKAQAEMDRVYAERESGRGSGRGHAPSGGAGRGGSRHYYGDYGDHAGEENEYEARESYQTFRDESSDSDSEGRPGRKSAASSQLRENEFDRESHPSFSSQQPARHRFIDNEDDEDEPPLRKASAAQQRPADASQQHQQYRQPSAPARPVVAPPTPAKPPPPPAVTATPAELATSTGHKDAGNAHFKNGQFGDADASYTLAIAALPSRHLQLAALYNNRAAARLKTGHYREAAEDCGVVQSMDPRDVKSLLRRATAYEAMEKWADALEDYRKVMGIDPSVKTASDGLGRCQKALRPPPAAASVTVAASAASAAPSKPVSQFAAFEDPTPASTSSESAYVSNAVNAAVQKLREQNRAAENEDDMKLALKDQTDDLINNWRRGKEDNLRALLSSLDTVLWAELQWKPINLSELITPQQVKIRYMKAVGRVHPDKLQQSATVEHRLIANGVFGTLNKGWDAFKAQNGLN
ncbi:hypothetical protein HDU86_000174 [Geranomyces michiganensis]|nr:hypothetical protein HDU86_000174 [Geranomyces michiganensis]